MVRKHWPQITQMKRRLKEAWGMRLWARGRRAATGLLLNNKVTKVLAHGHHWRSSKMGIHGTRPSGAKERRHLSPALSALPSNAERGEANVRLVGTPPPWLANGVGLFRVVSVYFGLFRFCKCLVFGSFALFRSISLFTEGHHADGHHGRGPSLPWAYSFTEGNKGNKGWDERRGWHGLTRI